MSFYLNNQFWAYLYPKKISTWWHWLKHTPKVREYALLIPLGLGMTALKIVMHGSAYQREGFKDKELKLLYTQEAVRQTISSLLWLGTLCFSYEFGVKKLFPQLSPAGRMLVSSLISQVPDTFVRPFLTAKVCKWILGTAISTPIKAPHASGTALQANTLAPQKPPENIPFQGVGAISPYYTMPRRLPYSVLYV